MPKDMPKVEEFLKDPQYQNDANFFRGLFNAFLDERAQREAEARKQQQGEKTFLQKLFDPE